MFHERPQCITPILASLHHRHRTPEKHSTLSSTMPRNMLVPCILLIYKSLLTPVLNSPKPPWRRAGNMTEQRTVMREYYAETTDSGLGSIAALCSAAPPAATALASMLYRLGSFPHQWLAPLPLHSEFDQIMSPLGIFRKHVGGILTSQSTHMLKPILRRCEAGAN